MPDPLQTLADVGEDGVVALIAAELAQPRDATGSADPADADPVDAHTVEADPGQETTAGAGSRPPQVLLGLGDDAAVLDLGLADGVSPSLVMSTDTMSQDQDFRLRWWSDPAASGFDIGVKAAAQNLSDLNAMGARPTALLVSLSLPGETTLEWVRAFYRGLKHACSRPGAASARVIGGDLGAAEGISVTITAVGTLASGAGMLRRDGARPGERVALAGTLGLAAAGLALLEASPGHGEEPAAHRSSGIGRCLAAQLRPDPPLGAGAAALRAGATAALDVSDGLLRDAARLERASGVRIRFEEDRLSRWETALRPAERVLGGSPRAADWVRAGGEDYALLATFPAGAELPAGFAEVGEVIAESGDRGSPLEHGAAEGRQAPVPGGSGRDGAGATEGTGATGWDSWRRPSG